MQQSIGLIKLSGQGATALLQGQVTCDVKETHEQVSRLGAHCDFKGRVLTTFRIFHHQAAYYLLLPSSMLTFLLQDLAKYAIFYKVTLEDVSTQWDVLGLIGSAAQAKQAFRSFTHEESIYNQNDTLLLSIPGPVPRIMQLTPRDSGTLPSQKGLDEYWQLADIQAGIATIYPETRGLFTPHQLHYHLVNGISFKKGCYTGQEIIARMHYRGTLKNQLYAITIHDALSKATGDTTTHPLLEHAKLKPGSPITDTIGQKQGILVMTASTRPQQGLACINNIAIDQDLHIENHKLSLAQVH